MTRLAIRWTAPVVLLLAGTIVVGLAPAPATAQASEDDAAIRSLWSALDVSWNARDADRFSRLFSDDVSFVFVDAANRWRAARQSANTTHSGFRAFPRISVI